MENSPLVQALRTPQGRKFMRRVSSIPGVYDLLERLTWHPDGKLLLVELIASPEGPKLLRTLLEPENLKELEHKLASDPRGRNLRLPTGHVYTAKQVLDHLQQKFSAARTK